MALIDFFRNWLHVSEAKCPFKTGDQVQPLKGGPLMIVEWVRASSQRKAHLICCKWFDRQRKENRMDIFTEGELKPFDWYHPD
jgi:uncharacterized protein YodC (DUF2158 family)